MFVLFGFALVTSLSMRLQSYSILHSFYIKPQLVSPILLYKDVLIGNPTLLIANLVFGLVTIFVISFFEYSVVLI